MHAPTERKTYRLVIFVAISFFCYQNLVNAQVIKKDNNCEDNESLLSVYSGTRINGTRLIVIAHQGAKEKTLRYTRDRLMVFRESLLRGLTTEQLVFAVGEKSTGNPRVDVYINGKLELIFEAKSTQIIKVGNCPN